MMKINFLPRKSEGPERIRNTITGSLFWVAALAVIVFLVLDPSETVQMQMVMEPPVTDVTVDPIAGPVESDKEQIGDALLTSDPVLGTPDAEQQTSTESPVVADADSADSEKPKSSIVFDVGTQQASEPVQTEPANTPTATVEPPAADKPQEVADSTDQPTTSTTGPLRRELFIQVAAFAKAGNAVEKQKEFSKGLYPVRVAKADNGMNLVLVGPYLTEAEAEKIRAELILKYQVQGSFLKFIEREATSTAGVGETVGMTRNESDGTPAAAPESEIADGWYVRVGVYKNLGNARTVKLRLDKLDLSTVLTRENKLNVLIVGPYQRENDANIARNKIRQEIKVADAYVVLKARE